MRRLINKIGRIASRGLHRSKLPKLNETIVSFGFDDCPFSAIETAIPMLEAEDWRATIYVACSLCDTTNHLGRHMSLSDIADVHHRGHEIADHTFSHLSAHEVTIDEYMADIEKNQQALLALGLPVSRHFAFPFGHVSPSLKKALHHKFETLRGVVKSKFISQDADLLNAVRLYSGSDLKIAIKRINDAKTSPQWLNLFTHDVRDNPSEYGCTPAEFKTVIKAVKEAGLRVMTVDQAFQTIHRGAS